MLILFHWRWILNWQYNLGFVTWRLVIYKSRAHINTIQPNTCVILTYVPIIEKLGMYLHAYYMYFQFSCWTLELEKEKTWTSAVHLLLILYLKVWLIVVPILLKMQYSKSNIWKYIWQIVILQKFTSSSVLAQSLKVFKLLWELQNC